MQLRRKLKRLAAIALSLVMALSCMPVGVLAEAATPTDLIPENMATPDEAAPEEHPHEEITEGVPAEAEMEVVPEAPATEEIPREAATMRPCPKNRMRPIHPPRPKPQIKRKARQIADSPFRPRLMNTAMCMYPLSDKPAYTARRIGSQNRWFTPRPRIFFLSWLRSFRLPHRSVSGFWTKPVKWSAAMYTQMIWIPAIC